MKQIPINIPEARPAARQRHMFARANGAGFDVKAANGATQIDLYDEIGIWGVTAAAFREKLNQSPGNILLRINSPGGDVFDGVAIYNDLLGHRGRVTVEVTGLAASAASIIAMAGDEIRIADNAYLMVHRSWGITIGNGIDHTETAKLLTDIDAALARTYSAKTGRPSADMLEIMTAETWMSGQAAVDAGFADKVINAASDAKARFDLSIYANAPTEICASADGETDVSSPVNLERILRSSGLSRRQAKAVTRSGWTGLANAEQTELLTLSRRIADATRALEGIQ